MNTSVGLPFAPTTRSAKVSPFRSPTATDVAAAVVSVVGVSENPSQFGAPPLTSSAGASVAKMCRAYTSWPCAFGWKEPSMPRWFESDSEMLTTQWSSAA